MEGIGFFCEDIDFSIVEEEKVKEWITSFVENKGYSVFQLDFVFCSDEYLLEVNKRELDHDFLTDIITFPLHNPGSKELIADFFISIDRVKDNALNLDVSFVDELHRVMIHGVLHLIGYDDRDAEGKSKMRQAEDFALALRMF